MAYVAFSNISGRLWLGDNAIWRNLSIKEIYQVFIEAYKPFTTSKTFKNFQSRTEWFDPFCPFKKKKEKKDKTAFDLRFTYQNFYPETILSSILRKFPQKALFIFFSILHHFRKIWIRDNTGWPILSLKKVQFLSKARMVRITLHFPTYLETLDQDITLY